MWRRLKTHLKHSFITLTLLALALIVFGVAIGADAHLIENPLAYKLDKEGPHIFFDREAVVVNHIRGDSKKGFQLQQEIHAANTRFSTYSYFALDGSKFDLEIDPAVKIPPATYDDQQPVLAISDIESGYKTFRDFLITNGVIDNALSWTFGRGHLVLVGDFVDRGASATQVLWFVYRLEQEAKKHGGRVHMIIGNHEIKNMQGNFQTASDKYFHIASIMNKRQIDLYGTDSMMGRWLASKNSIERINGVLYAHGGIHPAIAAMEYSLDDINRIVRAHYSTVYYSKVNSSDEDFLVSTTTGPSWYRGYFKDDLSQDDVEKGLRKFGAHAVVVGHTQQWKVNAQYKGRVFAIDVKHPRDYLTSFPPRRSEGLLIENNKYYRLKDDGRKVLLSRAAGSGL